MNIRSFFVFLSLLFSLVAKECGALDSYSHGNKDTTIYLLTCSPGAEIYSAFGHNAILSSIGREDKVYNYGTFDFNTDNFVLKFARGKLPYALSVQDLGYFQLEYLHDRRQVLAQELNLNSIEKKKLLDLLDENAKPENKFYKYDFFYDNCATRLKDILNQATDGAINWDLKPNQTNYSFRELIDIYAGDIEWVELGIDLALGLPCDKVLEPGEQSFLPDSLMRLFSNAAINGEPLITKELEILPKEEFETRSTFFQKPGWVLSLFSLLFGGVLFLLRKTKSVKLLAKIFLGINGLIGLLVFSLWFFTDHTATAFNMNLLWANPLNLVFIFFNSRKWWKVFLIINCMTLICWTFIPQDLHEAVLPLIALFMGSALILASDKLRL